MKYKIAILSLLINAGLYSCTKLFDSDPDTTPIDPVVQKPEWRVKKIFTRASNTDVRLGFDTTYFSYDSLGRFSSIDYRMEEYIPIDIKTPIGYSTHRARNINYEYLGNTEKIKKEYIKDIFGRPVVKESVVVNEYVYNSTQTQLTSYNAHDQAATPQREYNNLTYNNDKLTGFTYIQYVSPTDIDTSVTTITYTQNLITKQRYVGRQGAIIYEFNYEYNAAGNPVYGWETGEFLPYKPDTVLKTYFTWTPTITPNINKLKRPDRSFMEAIYFLTSFYTQTTFNSLSAFDIFHLTSNGELLNSYNRTYIMYNGLPEKMNFRYELDSNQNISKVIGTVPDITKGMTDMTIEYERIR